MTDIEDEANQEPHRNSDDEPMQKRPHLDPNEEAAKTITDLNDDCLEKIFDYLNPRELLNVALSNRWLRVAAVSVFAHKHRNKTVYLNYVEIQPRNTVVFTLGLLSFCWNLTITDLKECLQFLRCFGNKIIKLDISYSAAAKKSYYAYVDQYVNEYCAETLVEIEFNQRPIFLISTMKKPFKMVESVRIERSNLGNQIPRFAEWFPNLRRLELSMITVNRRFIEAPFRHLEHLSVKMSNNDKGNSNLSKKNIADFVRANATLQSLEIHLQSRQRFPFNELLTIIGGSSSITKLSVPYKPFYSIVDASDLSKLATALPSAVELNLERYKFSAANAISLVRQCKLLKLLRFRIDDLLDYYAFRAQLGDEWTTSTSSNGFRCITITKKQ